MANNQESEPLSPIDNDLFHSYTRYKLCQLAESTSLWTCSQEKDAMLNILAQFEKIDGNTLRMMVNQIFENSAQTYSFSDTNKEPLGFQEESSGAYHLENLPSPPGTVIAEVFDSEAIQNKPWTTRTITSITRQKRPMVIREPSLAKKSKATDRIIEKLKNLMSRTNLEELGNLTDHVERSKYVILTRMRRVSTSFKFKASTVTANYLLHVSNSFGDPRSPMSMCQMNLIAYRFGKLLEQGRFHSKDGKRKKAELECYQIIKEELNAHGKRIATPVYKYARYAQNVVEAAEKIGVYVLFIPEILTPYALQAISRNNFPILQKCLNVKCAGFKEIARLDHDGNLIMAEMNYSRKHIDKSYRRTKSKFLNSCA
ncbi:uncharacterized protein ATC70_006127 [Mucor velutinosus]|uniref:Uncharacterized protein n=1 Tax=Mucor velutinosus TaxID=708070 RepID=A0AAN7DBY0_9FUNG|nr:hypothetical protein ATC70_006127 [Mucor velutinosus]